jgi:beta-lactamase regulating signal transducer with metallopeptidase domain
VAEQVLRALLLQTFALALAAAAVRALQVTLLRPFGAAGRYLGWLLVPVALVAVALPQPAVEALAIHVDIARVAPAWIAPVAAAPSVAASTWPLALLVAWAAGVAGLALVLLRRQRGFEALVTRPSADAVPRLPAGSGPAVLGVWRRRVVLPLDFDGAFDAEERRLMLRHEGVHLVRADNAWNLLASALLVLHWFNPIAWWAWRHMRTDQETSCDAAVLREESPAALATYAGALLKVQGVSLAPPLATSWQSSHPLVERIRMLQAHRISSARHRAGLRLAALSILVAGVGGYALRAGAKAPPAPDGGSVLTAVDVRVDAGAPIHVRLLTRTGEKALVREEPDAKNALAAPLELAYTVTRLDGDRLQLDTTLRQGEPLATLGSPRVITRNGEAASIKIRSDDGAHEVAVSLLPRLVSTPTALPPLPPLAKPLAALPPLPATPATGALPPLPVTPPTAALPAPPATPSTDALPPPPADLPAPRPQRAL